MTDRNRFVITKVDVVVLVIVIGYLLALAAPSLLDPNPPGRRFRCMQNQKKIALALLNYESHHRHFPGYANRIRGEDRGNEIVTSWVVPLFPYLEREDLWRAWKESNRPAVALTVLTCPSDRYAQSDADSPTLSYVVNCGRPGDMDTPAYGVFHNHNVESEPVYGSIDYISRRDGSTNTLLFSENLQAGFWTDTDEANVGMVWHEVPGPSSHVNQDRHVGDRPQKIRYARPSSHHPGGVIASFCDGHSEFLSDKIDYRVYQHMMTPDSSEAGLPAESEEGDL